MSKRCETIGYNIQRIAKKYTSDYNINVCWRTEKLSKFYTPKLKYKNPPIENIGTVYEFECPGCNSIYIGETRRKLITRIGEHNKLPNPNNENDKKQSSAISRHIYGECDVYHRLMCEKYGPNPTEEEKLSFIINSFKIKQSNIPNDNDRKN